MAVALAYDAPLGAHDSQSDIRTLQLADWRRRMAELYGRVRNAPSPSDAWQLWCHTRNDLFRHHPQSPIPEAIRSDYAAIPCFDYDANLRFQVDIASLEDRTPESVEIGEGVIRLRPALETKGLISSLGKELTIYWIEAYGGGLFLPFRDATSGEETYGGGRYLLDSIKSADLGMTRDGKMVLDFNFAYHPSCAHNADWMCPLAPMQNTLLVPIRAGERL